MGTRFVNGGDVGEVATADLSSSRVLAADASNAGSIKQRSNRTARSQGRLAGTA
jgi:hypothetical protein